MKSQPYSRAISSPFNKLPEDSMSVAEIKYKNADGYTLIGKRGDNWKVVHCDVIFQR